MEVKVESKIGLIRQNEERIYSFLSDCNNFQQFAVENKVENWQSSEDSCSLTMAGVGNLTFRIVEKRPNDLIKYSIENTQAENVFLWVQLKNVNPESAKVKITAKLNVNPMLNMIISKPLKQGLDKMVDTLERIC